MNYFHIFRKTGSFKVSLYSRIFVIILMNFLSTTVFGQLSGNFDNTTCPTTAWKTIDNAFYLSCFPNWGSSHGTPYIDASRSSSAPNSAYMDYNAGIFTNYNFQQGITYTVSYKVYTKEHIGIGIGQEPCSPAKYAVYACNGLSNSNGTSPAITQKQVIHSYSYEGWDNWKTMVINNFVPNANYSQLWITPNNMNPYLGLWIDDVTITPTCGNSTSNVVFQNITLNTSTTTAGTIIAGENVNTLATPGKVFVHPGVDAKFYCYSSTALMPGFIAESGSLFAADVKQCAVTTTTCSDGIKNGDETGIDCGGSCAPCVGCYEPRLGKFQTEETEALNITAYPNPTSGVIQISVAQDTEGELSIFDGTGNKVKTVSTSQITNKGIYEVDLSKNPSGLYFIKLNSKDTSKSIKVVLAK